MFELPDPTRLKVRNVSPRKEVHGEELVQAIDVDLEWETSNVALAMFKAGLLGSFYEVNEVQTDLEGIQPALSVLRYPDLEMPLKWGLELLGRDFRVLHGLGGKSDLVLATAKVKKFRFTFKEGGTTIVGFQVQGNTDVNEKIVGKLCALAGEEIEATMTPSAGADEPKDDPAPKGKQPDATDLFLGTTVHDPDAKPSTKLASEPAWPFPQGDQPAAASKPPQHLVEEKAPAKKAAAKKLPYKYRNPMTGDTWSGRGLQPKWLKVALAGGRTLSEFVL